MAALLAAVVAIGGLGMAGCASAPSTTHASRVTATPKTDPFAVLDQQVKEGNIDPHLIDERVDAARQEWLRALVAQQKNQKTEVVKDFENSIDILNRLITYPGVDSNKDFQDVSKSVISDYSKYVTDIDSLPPNASIFAFREKFNEDLAKMSAKNIPMPPSSILNGPIPLTMNTEVEQSIAYFTEGNGRPYMEKWLTRTGKYFPMMKKILKEEGVPDELVGISMIESGLSPNAVSWARAVGMWQFIGGTGSLYGLHSNWWYDMRRDPLAATRAAARYFHDLYAQFGDWHLAIAAYNCGANRILEAESEAGSHNFWDLRPFLPKETQNYVPLFIAATVIALDPKQYGFSDVVYDQPLTFDTVHVREAIDLNALAKAAGVSELEVKELNPELLQPSTPPMELCGSDGYCLRLPAGSSTNFYDRLAAIPQSERRSWLVHTVGRGETMRSIAHLYGIDPSQLASYNDMTSRERVRRGERLRVPMTVMAPQTGSAASTAPEATAVRETVHQQTETVLVSHRVHRGETLASIARSAGVSMASVRHWNHLSRRAGVRKGEVLKLYEARTVSIPQNHTRTASAESANTSDETAQYHTVLPGETLTRIARNFATTPEQLSEWNDGLAASDLQGGMKIKVSGGNIASSQKSSSQTGRATLNASASRRERIMTPSHRVLTYRVRRGDTLTAISERFGVEIDALKHANHLRGSMLAAGLQLRIPH
ncbi:MAG: LysM peptidoglycan-binding domain-containing protein [Candidatus Kapaibacterium sp.]